MEFQPILADITLPACIATVLVLLTVPLGVGALRYTMKTRRENQAQENAGVISLDKERKTRRR